MSLIPELANLPDVSFTGDRTQAQIYDELVADYMRYLQDNTAEPVDLPAADPRRLLLLSMADIFHHLYQCVELAGREDLLKYATGAALDSLGAVKKLARNPASRAKATVRFSLTSARSSATGVPGGTRVSDAGENYFATDEYFEIPAGSLSGEVSVTAVAPGAAANGLAAGAIDVLVDQTPYIASAVSTTASAGGADIESDDDFTRRIYNAPFSWSVAGPAGAYEYWARQSRADIDDVLAYSPSAANVSVIFTLDGGTLPTESDCTAMQTYLSDRTIRPVADRVTVSAPSEQSYSIALTYYISRADSAQAATIQAAVGKAIDEYTAWQRSIGRDVNPSELIYRIMAAGARRVALTSPAYATVEATKIAKLATKTVSYGGLEDE